MALKEEPYALPLKLGGQTFAKATACGANSCVLASYFETPSIAWMSTSPLVVDGEILVLPKYNGWSQKTPLRGEWPHAVSIWKRPGSSKSLALFVYHLAEAAYYVMKINGDAQTVLMMGYERAAVVLKDSILLYTLSDPTRAPAIIPASIASQVLPNLCIATSDTLWLTGYNTIQEWRVDVKTAQARLVFQTRVEGFGFCDLTVYESTIVAISQGGAKLHLYDSRAQDDARSEEPEVCISSAIPITKLFIDDEVILTGLADGTMKLYDRELRQLVAQLNVIPVAARRNAPAAGESSAAPTYLQHKISFLARFDELVIAAMLDPSATAEDDMRQLEVSIWPIRGQNVVQPLKTKLLPGTVNFMHYDERVGSLFALTQYHRPSDEADFHGGRLLAHHSASVENKGPLIGVTWHPPYKSLQVSGLRWRETNDQQQAKLAQEVMEQVLLEPSFFRAMFLIEADTEEIEQVVDSMFNCLAGRENLQVQFLETAIMQEIVLGRTLVPSAHSSPALIHSAPHDAIKQSSKNSPQLSASTSSLSSDSSSKSSSSSKADSNAAPPQYFPPNSMTTAVISKVLKESSSSYINAVLTKPFSVMLKADVMFSLPSTHAAPEDQPMFTTLIKVTAGIVDGLIDNQSKFSVPLQRMLQSIHQAVCSDNPHDSELRSFRRGAARVFLDYVLLKRWLDPIGAGLVSTISDEVRHNLRVVAQLMQVICGYSKHKLSDPALCSLVTEYSTKWRGWLLSKVAESGDPKLKDKDKRKAMARGISFVAPKSSNNKLPGLIVTKFIITHAQELLAVMNREGRTPDPAATKIRAISESLLLSIMSLMAKKGTKHMQLAASLKVFGASRSNSPFPTGGSRGLHSSSSESTSEGADSGPKDEQSEGSEELVPLPRKKKRRPTSVSIHSVESVTSSSADGKTASDSTTSEMHSSSESPTLHVEKRLILSPKPLRNKKISSGSLTNSSHDDDRSTSPRPSTAAPEESVRTRSTPQLERPASAPKESSSGRASSFASTSDTVAGTTTATKTTTTTTTTKKTPKKVARSSAPRSPAPSKPHPV